MSLDLEREELQCDHDVEGDGLTCLSVASVEISGIEEGLDD